MREWFSAAELTLPNGARVAPPVRVPTTRTSALRSALAASSVSSGAPARTSALAAHPARFSIETAASACICARLARSRLDRMASLRSEARIADVKRRVTGGTHKGSLTVTTMAWPPRLGSSLARKRTARRAPGEPSNPTTRRRTPSAAVRATSTGRAARATIARDTLPASRRRTAPWPRQPSAIASARKRRASPRMASTGESCSATASASGHRRARRRRAGSVCW